MSRISFFILIRGNVRFLRQTWLSCFCCSSEPSSRPTNWSAVNPTNVTEGTKWLFSQKCIAKKWSTRKLLNERAHEAKHVLSFVTLRKYRGQSDPSRSLHDHFITCTSANAIYCITCTLYLGETRRRLGDRFREHRDAEEHAKDASKPVTRHFISSQYMYSTIEKQHPTTL